MLVWGTSRSSIFPTPLRLGVVKFGSFILLEMLEFFFRSRQIFRFSAAHKRRITINIHPSRPFALLIPVCMRMQF